MHCVCISASNIQHARETSTSTRACKIATELLGELDPQTTSDVIALSEHELRPCTGCGACYQTGRCALDPVFNALYERVIRADMLFIAAAHYAPIPAKLCMLLEKIEQLTFLPRFHDETRHSPLYHKPAGIIGHCGGTEELLKFGYKGQILDTITNALGWPVEMKVTGAGPEWPNGVLFPVARVTKDERSPFPVQEYDWEDVRRRIEPLVKNVYARCLGELN